MVQPFHTRNVVIPLFILVIAAFRVLINMNGPVFPLANFSPVGAIALFSGAYIKHPGKSLMFPILILLLSDFVLSLLLYRHYESGFLYSGWYCVYSAFALMVLTARRLVKKIRLKNILIAVIAITFIHWTVSDLGVWLMGTTYAKNAAGYWACLVAAVPFERNFLAGTALYSVILFGGVLWLQNRKLIPVTQYSASTD